MRRELKWIAVSGPGPKWKRSVAVDEAGVIYAPGAIVGEQQALFCAAYDGVRVILDKGHAYLPLDWLMREFPKIAELGRKIERRVKEHFA